jgi:uncharacterized protein UPF0158
VLDLSNIDLEEIADALADQTDYEHHWLINPHTGEIAFWTADTGIDGQTPVELDELDLVVIGPLPSWVWYQDMADFADGITDERAGRRLARAIQGKGAFRRFKDELHEEHPDLLPAWYAFRDTRARRRAVQWLADNSLIDDSSADRFLSGHPDPRSALSLWMPDRRTVMAGFTWRASAVSIRWRCEGAQQSGQFAVGTYVLAVERAAGRGRQA